MMKQLRVRIIGGSLAGLFAGILLQRDGHDVKMFERSASGLAGRGAGLVGQQDLFRTAPDRVRPYSPRRCRGARAYLSGPGG